MLLFLHPLVQFVETCVIGTQHTALFCSMLVPKGEKTKASRSFSTDLNPIKNLFDSLGKVSPHCSSMDLTESSFNSHYRKPD